MKLHLLLDTWLIQPYLGLLQKEFNVPFITKTTPSQLQVLYVDTGKQLNLFLTSYSGYTSREYVDINSHGVYAHIKN